MAHQKIVNPYLFTSARFSPMISEGSPAVKGSPGDQL